MKIAEIVSRQRILLTIAALTATTIPRGASAHVKWFCSTVDVTRPPIPLSDVLTPVYLACFGAFIFMVFAGFLLDGWVARRWPALASSGALFAGAEENLMRLATGAYFLLLWDKGAVVLWDKGDAILTPELLANIAWMNLLQFAVAVLVIWRRSCILSALGILILYGYGITQFGVFHMTDYVFFPGIAAYLALTSLGTPRALRLRVPVLGGALAFSLMWTAIEKFVYPQWTLVVVAEHPDLAAGFPMSLAVVIAGFVEFTLAFYLVTGRGLLRLGAAGYAGIFLIAIPEFGHLDAVGHIPVVGILGVLCLHGASPLQNALRRFRGHLAWDAAAISLLYLVSLIGMFAMYYGLQWAEYS